MSRAAATSLLLASLALGGERTIAEFRLADGTTLRGWVLTCDDRGLRFERFGGGRPLDVAWEDVREEDRVRLRRELRLDPPTEEDPGLVAGHRLHLKDGTRVEGLLVRVDEDGGHWLKRHGLVLSYPAGRVDRVEAAPLDEEQVFDGDEIYARRLKRLAPGSARSQRELADHLFGRGDLVRARRHYAEAVRIEPALAAELGPRIDTLSGLLADQEVTRLLERERSRYRLRKDYAGARARVRALADEHPDRQREMQALLDDLEARERADLVRRLHALKHDELDAALDRYLGDARPLEETLSWVRNELPREIERGLAERLGLPPEEVAALLAEPAGGAVHWAAYGTGSFVFSNRAHKGPPSRKVVRGDPERWWRAYGDRSTRAGFLRAYAAERLPLFEVVDVRLRDCDRCGGKGLVRHVSTRESKGVEGGHEWHQVCPRCYGARRDRSVAYR